MNNNKEKIIALTKQLNEYRNAYYNNSVSLVSDAEYDRLFEQRSCYFPGIGAFR